MKRSTVVIADGPVPTWERLEEFVRQHVQRPYPASARGGSDRLSRARTV